MRVVSINQPCWVGYCKEIRFPRIMRSFRQQHKRPKQDFFGGLHLSGGRNLGGGSWDWLSSDRLLDGGGSSLSGGRIRGGSLGSGLFGRLLGRLLNLGGLAALHGGTELGEGGERFLLLSLVIAGDWLLLLGQPWEGTLALLALGDGSLRGGGLTVSGRDLGSSLRGSQRLGRFNSRDHRSGLSDGLGVLGWNNRGLGLRLLILAGELRFDSTKDAVALDSSWLGVSLGGSSLLSGLQNQLAVKR